MVYKLLILVWKLLLFLRYCIIYTQDLCVSDYTTFPKCGADDSVCHSVEIGTSQ